MSQQPAAAPQPPAEDAPPPTELYPLPVGKLVYESLKTAFVENEVVKGEWCDEYVYAMLSREWAAIRQFA